VRDLERVQFVDRPDVPAGRATIVVNVGVLASFVEVARRLLAARRTGLDRHGRSSESRVALRRSNRDVRVARKGDRTVYRG
jgi:hypothetical protein